MGVGECEAGKGREKTKRRIVSTTVLKGKSSRLLQALSLLSARGDGSERTKEKKCIQTSGMEGGRTREFTRKRESLNRFSLIPIHYLIFIYLFYFISALLSISHDCVNATDANSNLARSFIHNIAYFISPIPSYHLISGSFGVRSPWQSFIDFQNFQVNLSSRWKGMKLIHFPASSKNFWLRT